MSDHRMQPRTRKALLSALLLLGVAGSAVGGAFATFTESVTSAGQTVTTGKVIYLFGATQTNRLAVGASNIAAGDTIQRAFELDNNSTISGNPVNDLASVTFGVTATASSLLDTDVTNGLQETVRTCSVPWTEGGVAPAYTYVCGGVSAYVIGSAVAGVPVGTAEVTPVAVSAGLNSLAAAGKDYLVLTLTLPSTAPGDLGKVATACSGTAGGTSATENLEGCSSTLQYTFTAVQRAGISQ